MQSRITCFLHCDLQYSITFSYGLPYFIARYKLEMHSNITYIILKSNRIVSVENDGFFYWVSNRRKNRGNEGNFVMTQLNAASQSIESHVAVRAESEQTRKHWSTLTTSDLGWFIPEEAQRGVWMVYMCVCVGTWACGFMSLVFWVWVGILCYRSHLGICEISLKGGNIPRHCQLSPFGYINLCSLPNIFRHFTKISQSQKIQKCS